MIRRLRCRSLSTFVEAVCRLRTEWTSADGLLFDIWFRGQADVGWGLTPSLYRLGLEEYEEEIRADFVRRAIQLTPERQPSSDWGWYFAMQHYGVPTRLLDWTTSALVALFFATNSNAAADTAVKRNPAVWILDPWWLNQQLTHRNTVILSDWDDAAPYLPRLYANERLRRRYPIAIDPPHVARRVAVQSSCFTVFGTDPRGLEAVAKRPRSRLACIEIQSGRDGRFVDEIRVDLRTCGITDSILFPDLEGLSRELTRYYKMNWYSK